MSRDLTEGPGSSDLRRWMTDDLEPVNEVVRPGVKEVQILPVLTEPECRHNVFQSASFDRVFYTTSDNIIITRSFSPSTIQTPAS